MANSGNSPRIPDWVVVGSDSNGHYLANSETGEKTGDKDKAEKMPIHEAVEAKRHGTITNYTVERKK